MSRHIILQPHLSREELERRYRAAKEPHERRWWQILWLLSQGRTGRAVASVTGYSPYWIGQIAQRYNREGPVGMQNRRHTTSHRTPLTLAQQEERRQTLAAAARGERWTGNEVADGISERRGRRTAYSLGDADLKRLKYRLQLPRPHQVQADPVAQEQFKTG